MQTHIASELPPQWHSWISDSLRRGCSRLDMAKIMVDSHFEVGFACAAIERLEAIEAIEAIEAARAPAGARERPRLPQQGRSLRAGGREVTVSLRVAQPVLAIFEDVLTAQECDELIRLARPRLKRSEVIAADSAGSTLSSERSSCGTFFSARENAFIAGLESRIAELMHWPEENGEGLQVLNYGIGGQYRPHHDYFPRTDAAGHRHLAGGQRVSTLLIYLNDVDGGGETSFPAIQLSVTPRRGSAVYFEYCDSRGQVDPATLHGAAPVTAGEKWIATKWMREKAQR